MMCLGEVLEGGGSYPVTKYLVLSHGWWQKGEGFVICLNRR